MGHQAHEDIQLTEWWVKKPQLWRQRTIIIHMHHSSTVLKIDQLNSFIGCVLFTFTNLMGLEGDTKCAFCLHFEHDVENRVVPVLYKKDKL